MKKSTKSVNETLLDATKVPPSNSPSGFLAKLARHVLIDHKFAHNLDHLVNRYLARTQTVQDYTLKKKNKSTLIKEICSNEMSIKVFMDLLFNILEAEKVTVTVDIKFPSGKEVTVSSGISVGKPHTTKKEKDDGKSTGEPGSK